MFSVPRTQVSLILNDAALFELWKQDIKTMAGRIIEMRHELHKLLTHELKTPGNWDHIINQIGMFRYVRFAFYTVARSPPRSAPDRLPGAPPMKAGPAGALEATVSLVS